MENLLNHINGIVIKVGTAGITTSLSVDLESISNIAKHTTDLIRMGKHVTIVTSGAIAAGRRKTGLLSDINEPLPKKQMLAAVGQTMLMDSYSKAFQDYGLTVAQFLVSTDNFRVKNRLHSLEDTYIYAQNMRIVPIFNENDPVATEEIKFGDNDHLQFLIATALPGNEVLINLTRRDGILKAGRLIKNARSYNPDYYGDLSQDSKEGRGGLKSKLHYIRKANEAGKTCIVGNVSGDIVGMLNGSYKHTRFSPR